MKALLSTVVAILSGLVVLTGYFFNIPLLTQVRGLLLSWSIILAAVLVFIGLFNLLSVNLNRINARQRGGFYRMVLVLSMLVTLLLGLIYDPNHPVMLFIFNTIQLPVEKSLMALLAVTLLVAGIRLLSRQVGLFSILFLATAVLILLGTAPLPFGGFTFFSDVIKPFIAQVLASAGARGILLGVALATLTTGLRILFAADRPYGGQ